MAVQPGTAKDSEDDCTDVESVADGAVIFDIVLMQSLIPLNRCNVKAVFQSGVCCCLRNQKHCGLSLNPRVYFNELSRVLL